MDGGAEGGGLCGVAPNTYGLVSAGIKCPAQAPNWLNRCCPRGGAEIHAWPPVKIRKRIYFPLDSHKLS
jgi:hypothetical protein